MSYCTGPAFDILGLEVSCLALNLCSMAFMLPVSLGLLARLNVVCRREGEGEEEDNTQYFFFCNEETGLQLSFLK